MKKNRPQTTHFVVLDGFRGAAALLVVFHHAWLQSWPYSVYAELKPTGLTALLTNWLAFGKVAVTAFIVISGFCLMLPIVCYRKHVEPRRFFLRRCRRILPPYYFALSLAIILDSTVIWAHSGTMYDTSFPLTTTGVLSHFFLVQNFTANIYQIAGPFWSIAVEFQIYLFFPLFVWIYRRYGLPVMLGVTTALGLSTSYLFNRLGLYNTYSHYVAIFGFGMCAAHLAFTLKKHHVDSVVRICYAMVPCLLLAAAALHHQLGSSKLITDTLMGMLTAVSLTLAVLSPQSLFVRVFSIKPLVWIGSFSYSFYLIHFPLQQLLWQLIAHPAGWSRSNTFLFVSLAGTPCIIALAFGFFWMFERPYIGESKDQKQRLAMVEVLS